VESAADLRGKAATALRLHDWRQNIIYIGFLAVFVFFAVTQSDSGFLSTGNLLNVFRQTASVAVMAVAMTFVIAAAEIDLSVGAVAGLASVVAALAMPHGTILGVLAGLGVGLLVGVVNGSLVSLLKVPSFLVTLGMLGLISGFARFITDSKPVPIQDATFNLMFGGGDLGPIPGLMVWALVFVAAGTVVMNRTKFGRQVLATGASETAARFTGVKTMRIKFQVLVMSGTAAAVAGLLYAGRLQSGRFQWGTGDELLVIAAVILGGTSLFGGRGRVVGTLFGSLLISLVNNGLILAGLDVAEQQMVRGAIIVAAVALSREK